MIANVIGSYLDSISEREFDAPFMSLLRSLGFFDIHFMHGMFEFGKDFIAKRAEQDVLFQYTFQTKAGDLNLSAWNACRGQIDMLRTDALAHPSFDSHLDRQAVLVLTGRLVGGATLQAQQYREHLQQLGETGFAIWDRERLIELISVAPETGFSDLLDGALMELIGHIDLRRVQENEIERFSRRWLGLPHRAAIRNKVVEAAILANRLRRFDRLDQACLVALALLRTVWANTHGAVPPSADATWSADAARDLFQYYAHAMLDNITEDQLSPDALIGNDPCSYVTYPARCLRIGEILGLLYLLECENADEQQYRLPEMLRALVRSNPGTAHPLSDRWAVSLIPIVLTLARSGHALEAEAMLTQVGKWLADRYEDGVLGLAGPYALPEEEVERLLGSPYEHISHPPRSESYAAAIVLDLAAVLEMGDLYDLARNEFLAVNILLPILEVPDTEAQYRITGQHACFTANMEYAETWSATAGERVAPHHARIVAPYIARIGRHWDLLAVSAVLRDRHFLEALHHFRPRDVHH